ncbi:MAG TPA: hypothetical protein DCP92_03460 [Nitrospiraceae bacterium]|jgi:hypothetical protein|nr:hypothetical protein [Nitrospiraceae bacterium]
MKLKLFFGNKNPLWYWLVSAEMLGVSAYMMYLCWAYAWARGDYLTMLWGIPVFSLSFAWVSWMFAGKALYMHSQSIESLEKEEKLYRLTRRKRSLESELHEVNEEILAVEKAQ